MVELDEYDARAIARGTENEAQARVESLLTRLETTVELPERAALLVAVARTLRDALGDREQALDALVEAWRADPLDESVLEELEPLLRSENRFADLLAETSALATSEPVRDRALAYHEAMVRWLTSDLPDIELARQWVERVRAIDPTHALVHVVQAALSREHGDVKRELEELDRAVLSTRRKDERAQLHLVLAARYLEGPSPQRALAKRQYEQAHRLFPKAMAPLRGLEQLALTEGDKVVLADVLRREADADVAVEERIAILRRLATVEEKDFRRPELAARTLERAVSLVHDGASLAPAAYDAILDDLERCYRAARMWPELLAVLERAAIGDVDADKRGACLKRLGEVLETKLGDIRSALETYQRIAGLMPDDETVVTELARLAEKAGDVALAVNSRERLADLTSDRIASARHNVVAGQLVMPIDAAAARRYFERAVRADPTNASAWNALVWDARSSSDSVRIAEYLATRAAAMEAPRVRATYFVELAEHYARSGDAVAERNAYLEAIRADPTNESAASALLVPLVREGRFDDAEPLAEVVAMAAERDRDVARLFAARQAQTAIAFALAKPELALRAALVAHDLRPEDASARADLIRAASDLRADPRVLSARESLARLAERADGLEADDRVRLAEVLALIGETESAGLLFEDALAERPDDERSLVGLAQHYAASGNKAASLRLRRQLALAVVDPGERFVTLVDVGDALAKIAEDDLAAEVYESARALVPTDLGLLHKLLALYQRTTRWANLYDVLGAIADTDRDPLRRAKTLFAMGQIASTELLDRGAALEMFDRSLDVDPSQLEAFESIVRILEAAEDWSGLERMYRKMIARSEVVRDAELATLLGKQLGALCRDRLGDVELAAKAFEDVIRLRGGDEDAEEQLRDLLANSGREGGAVTVTLERVLRDPLNPRPYPALFDLLVARGTHDRAYAAASAMRFLDVRHPPADAWYRARRRVALSFLGAGRDVAWEALLHPDLDRTLSEIFEIVAPAVIELALSRLSFRARMRHPGPTLRRHDDLAADVTSAARALGLPVPKLFVRTSPVPALSAGITKAPTLGVYPAALEGLPADVRAFKIGKRVLELAPPLLARVLCPSISELKALAASAARIATDQAEASDKPLAQRLAKDDIARLSAAVSSSLARDGKLDVLRWSELADLSTARAGLLLAGDLEAARAALASEPQAPGDLSPREKMRALTGWFLGDAAAELRERLGLANA